MPEKSPMVPPITDIWVSTVFFTSLKMKIENRTVVCYENKEDKKIPADLVKGGRVKVDLHQLKRFIIPWLTYRTDLELGTVNNKKEWKIVFFVSFPFFPCRNDYTSKKRYEIKNHQPLKLFELRLTEICSWRIEDQVLGKLCLPLIIFFGQIFKTREIFARGQLWNLFLDISIEAGACDGEISIINFDLIRAQNSSRTADFVLLLKTEVKILNG